MNPIDQVNLINANITAGNAAQQAPMAAPLAPPGPGQPAVRPGPGQPYPPYPPYQAQPAPMQGPYQPYPPYPPQYPPYPPYPQPAGPRFSVKTKDPRKAGGRRAVNRLSLLVAAQVALSLVFEMLIIAVSMAAGYNVYYDSMGLVWLTIAMSPLTTASPFFVYMLVGKKDWNQFLRFEKAGFFTGLLCALAGLAMCLLADIPALALQDFLKSLGAKTSESVLGNAQTLEGFWLELVGVAVLVPVMEEFAFRGVLFSALRRYGTGFAVFVSGLLFGMAHLDISSVLFASIAGITMGFFYAKTNNLWVPIAIHMFNNAIAVVGSYADLLAGPQANSLLEMLTVIPIGLGFLAFLLLLIFRRKKIFSRRPADAIRPPELPPLRTGEAMGCIATAPCFWCIVALVLVNTASMFL